MTIIEGVLDVPIMMIPFTIILSIYAIILYRGLMGFYEYKSTVLKLEKTILEIEYNMLKKQIEDEKNNR